MSSNACLAMRCASSVISLSPAPRRLPLQKLSERQLIQVFDWDLIGGVRGGKERSSKLTRTSCLGGYETVVGIEAITQKG
jgi:hypothetical protein